MSRAVLFMVVLVSIGCATYKPIDVSLYGIYSSLSDSVLDNDILEDRNNYFSSRYLSEIIDGNKETHFLLTIPSYIYEVESHHEMVGEIQGCLTINGFEKSGEPVTIYVEYINESNNWYVNYMHVNLLETSLDFVNKAICPQGLK